MNHFSRILLVFSLAGLGFLSTNKAQAASFEIDPTYTFLKTYVDTTDYNGVKTIAGDTTAISLADLGLQGGNSIRLNISGKFNWSVWNPGEKSDMIGVFSASKKLLDASAGQRVADAITLNSKDSNEYGYTQTNWTSRTLFDSTYYSGSTYDWAKNAYMCSDANLSDSSRTCGQQTLFDGVFGIFGEMTIQIPTNAKFLFLAVNDIFYSDNTGKMLVNITKVETIDNQNQVPEPNTVLGAIATLALALRMKLKNETKALL
ncbi:MAG: hypothetical protein RMX96_13235 [Nostoc sp. ChiSLP02]|nr:hypothetical protein [Nostoc sp. DedSLP05]MDZ8099019.1 hypothetical protein [Nostoc sp. DedSLP01]MDZ8185805.1 hypothetical protein [Nostoc sp. ChiSLP02]